MTRQRISPIAQPVKACFVAENARRFNDGACAA